MLDDVNILFAFKSLLIKPSNVLPLNLKQTFPSIIWIFNEVHLDDGVETRIPFKIFSTLCSITKVTKNQTTNPEKLANNAPKRCKTNQIHNNLLIWRKKYMAFVVPDKLKLLSFKKRNQGLSLESVQDFLIRLDMKPCMQLLEISIFFTKSCHHQALLVYRASK